MGLRFVEKQGRVEVQLKSGDASTAKTLSDNLAGLRTTLNEGGWDMEGGALDRPLRHGPEHPSWIVRPTRIFAARAV